MQPAEQWRNIPFANVSSRFFLESGLMIVVRASCPAFKVTLLT